MTAFEKFFSEIKYALENDELFEIWPSFSPQFNKEEYFWSKIGNLGEVLILNCCSCDGPSDPRHKLCEKCIEERKKLAEEEYRKSTSSDKPSWNIVMLCRVYRFKDEKEKEK